MRKTISVNDPLRYGGITIYQTDWSLSALQILKDNEGPFNLAMAPLQINGDKKLYGTFLPIGDVNSSDVKGMYVSFISTCNLWRSLVFVSLLENHLAYPPIKCPYYEEASFLFAYFLKCWMRVLLNSTLF